MSHIHPIAVCIPFWGIAFAAECAVGQQLRAGDAEMDLDYDQCDWVQVLVAAKYQTGEPATWGEGDFDGAPGGEPGRPPAGNGFFDELDFVKAIDPGNIYLTGPYDAGNIASEPCEGLRITPNGLEGDNQASVVYDATTGEVGVDVPADMEVTSININSSGRVFTGDRHPNLDLRDGPFNNYAANNTFKATIGSSFESMSLGRAKAGLAEDFLLNDLSVIGSLAGGGGLGNVDLVYRSEQHLESGDSDMDLDFDQLDLVQVQIAAKYLTGQTATWGEGDWDGAPGGLPGSPPAGDGLFNQFDIVAPQQGAAYLTGPYAAVHAEGTTGDSQTSVIYNSGTGKLAIDAPTGLELTSINIDSAAGIFTGQAAENLGGSFDNDTDANIFKATFGGSFGSVSFGNVAQTGLSEQFLLSDLSVVGSLAGGGDLGNVDLVYVPEPSTALLLAVALVIALRRSRHAEH